MFLFKKKKDNRWDEKIKLTQQIKYQLDEQFRDSKEFVNNLSQDNRKEYYLFQVLSCLLVVLYYLGVWIPYKKGLFILLTIFLVVELIIAITTTVLWRKNKDKIRNSKLLLIPAIVFVLAVLALAGMILKDAVNGNFSSQPQSSQPQEQQVQQIQQLNENQVPVPAIETVPATQTLPETQTVPGSVPEAQQLGEKQISASKYEQWLKDNNLIQGEK